MASVHEQISKQFWAFERRGRGWHVYDEPVSPEPPFEHFDGYSIAAASDDGLRPTALSSLVSELTKWLSPATSPKPLAPSDPPSEPEPCPMVREEDIIEFQACLPSNLRITDEALEAFFANLKECIDPISFEIVSLGYKVFIQFAASPVDESLLKRVLRSYFPEVSFVRAVGSLSAFQEQDDYCAIVEFGLAREFFHQIPSARIDPFVGIIGALSDLLEKECAAFQVIFQPCQHPWSDVVIDHITEYSKKSLFVNRPELLKLAEEKFRRPVYGVLVRAAARGGSFERSWEILRSIGSSLRVYSDPNGNELIPLQNDKYPFEDHLEDLLKRQSRRSGMLLNQEELIGFVHLPSSEVRSPRLVRQIVASKTAPSIVTTTSGLLLGDNLHAGESRSVHLTPEQRTRHVHVIGASGTGKSTFLFNSVRQDIESGEGLAVLDPHGDLIDQILGVIPANRIGDVILIDPSDETASIGFNVLSAHSELEKTLLASDLVSVFQRLSQSWGDQMESVFRTAILAFLESSRGGTLADLRRFLLDAKYRKEFLKTVKDPDICFFWEHSFTQLSGNKSIGSVLTRLETFLSPKPLRYMVAQRRNRLDFAHILDSGKILLAKLSQGAIGKENAYLLGSLLMAKLQQAAMSRQNQNVKARRDFWIFLDEFQHFITPSMTEILSGARKYRIGLTLAHQELRQLDRDREVASAVLSNCYTRVVFRVGDDDAKKLESGFASFSARDLQNLAIGEAIVRVERSDFDFNLVVPLPLPAPKDALSRRNEVIQSSRQTYATSRELIENELIETYQAEKKRETPPKPEPSPRPKRPFEDIISDAKPVIPNAAAENEVQKTTVKPVPPADPGRGGEQHSAIQKRIKAACEQLGYLATIEAELSDKSGSVDVAVLENGKKKVAIEIGITTTIDHEVGNVLKCLRAEFPIVAVVTASEVKLSQMKVAVSAAVGPDLLPRIQFFVPDDCIKFLKALPREATKPPAPKERKTKGYTVKRSAVTLKPQDLKAKEDAVIRLLAEAMKRKD
jgi:hypothetical protein